MAIYGRDFYGRSYYGGPELIPFSVDPFTAQPTGFDSVLLSWGEPGGDWGGFRLVRSKMGTPVTEGDGDVLVDIPVGYDGQSPGYYTDSGLPGGWYYYAIFIYDNLPQNWVRIGTVDALVPHDYSSTDKMWDLLPEYYKEVKDPGAGFSQTRFRINPAIYYNNQDVVPNDQLVTFLHVFGWATDILRSQAEHTLDGYDVDRVHMSRLALVAQQFGADIERTVPAASNRSLVRNLGWLYRKRGTLDGIRELVSLVSGWECDVVIGPNLMLSEDQADFRSPDPQVWDPSVRYVLNDRVQYGSYLFQAKGVAYGVNQAPPVTKTSNAYWDVDRFIEPDLNNEVARSDTGDISTWQIKGPGGAQPGWTYIGLATMDPEDNTLQHTNSLAFKNTSATNGANFIVRSVPRLVSDFANWDKQLVIESGIPVPRALEDWDSTVRYRAGDMVLYLGSPYQALGTTSAIPTDTTAWSRLGYDDRVRLCLSYFTHGPFNGTVGTGGLPIDSYLVQFDQNGDELFEGVLVSSLFTNVMYDPFGTSGDLNTASQRTPAVGSGWSTLGSGTWVRGVDSTGGYVGPPTSGRSYQVTNALVTDMTVGATYKAIGTRLMGVIARFSDASNYWIATQTGLYKYVAGVRSAAQQTWLPFVVGDRISVSCVGNAITVFKNGNAVGAVSDAFNNTATRFGVGIEP